MSEVFGIQITGMKSCKEASIPGDSRKLIEITLNTGAKITIDANKAEQYQKQGATIYVGRNSVIFSNLDGFEVLGTANNKDVFNFIDCRAGFVDVKNNQCDGTSDEDIVNVKRSNPESEGSSITIDGGQGDIINGQKISNQYGAYIDINI